MQQDIVQELEQRLGEVHARQRLGIEQDHENIFGHGINFFHPENWYSAHSVLRVVLKLTGFYSRGHKNTERIQVRHNIIELPGLSAQFDGFTMLHITDMHADMNPGPMQRLIESLPGLRCDICVMTGDFRGQTFGPFEAALGGLASVRNHIQVPIYAVLGNHDTIKMVPEIESMGIRMLLNESEMIVRGDQHIHLAGVDDAHYYRADNIEKAASAIPREGVSILLSHTPEIYRQAAHAGFQVMLS
jgi:predicted MPP superfamily phosphohydrolase